MPAQSARKKQRSPVPEARNRRPVPKPRVRASAVQIRVLVADDHLVVREGLVAIIDRQPDMEVVAQARNGREVVELWKRHRPDIALLDLRMPQLDGVAAIHAIRSRDAGAKAILLTSFDSDEDIYRGMRAGAKAYLLKDGERGELLECIRTVHAGGVCLPPVVAAKLGARVAGEELTSREEEVLLLLADGRSNKEIGAILLIGETTVKSHVKSLFAKLKVLSRTEAVSAATRRGLIRF